MRVDNGINGDAQRIEQMTWLFKSLIEEDWDLQSNYINSRIRWRNGQLIIKMVSQKQVKNC